MTQSKQPATKAKFREQLEELIRAAEANDIDIAGGYSFRTDGDGADWGLELLEVVKPDEDDA
jgi:hypothetical protein